MIQGFWHDSANKFFLRHQKFCPQEFCDIRFLKDDLIKVFKILEGFKNVDLVNELMRVGNLVYSHCQVRNRKSVRTRFVVKPEEGQHYIFD